MKIKYIGRHHNGVTIPAAGDLFVEHGATVDVPADIAESLLRQDGQWAKPKTPKPKTPTPPADADNTQEGDES